MIASSVRLFLIAIRRQKGGNTRRGLTAYEPITLRVVRFSISLGLLRFEYWTPEGVLVRQVDRQAGTWCYVLHVPEIYIVNAAA